MQKLSCRISPSGLVEASQNLKFKYAWCVPNKDGSFKTITTFVKCKDYFNELLWSESLPKDKPIPEANVYGFTWKVGKYNLDKENTYIALSMDDEEQERFEQNHKILADIHTLLGLGSYKLFPVQCTSEYALSHTYMYVGPKEVQEYLPILSLVTLFMRVCANELKYESFMEYLDDWDSPDREAYNNDIYKILRLDLDSFSKFLQGWRHVLKPLPDLGCVGGNIPKPSGATYNRVHNDSGIYSICNWIGKAKDLQLTFSQDNPNIMFRAAYDLHRYNQKELSDIFVVQ